MATCSSSPWFYHLLPLFLLMATIKANESNSKTPFNGGKCNIFRGRWVHEKHSLPSYNYTSCPFIRPQFDCQRNGRPDSEFLRFRWQPHECSLPKFDAHDFLRRFRNKKILFVGDSLMLNQWQSLTCLIHSAFPKAKYSLIQHPPMNTFHLHEYNLTIMMQWHQFLVEIEKESKGRLLVLDYIKGDGWRDADLLVFDSYHWWYYKKPNQPWDFMEVEGKTYSRLNRTVALKIALENWERWIDHNVDHCKTRVFYQGISPSHYTGSDWGQPKIRGCSTSKLPISGEGENLKENPAVGMVKSVISRMRHPADFLDIWHLSLMRPDGHPSLYATPARGPRGPATDCTHWCLPGLPDTWNQLLYTALL
ncbi:hypothetical protein V2J09_009117 [Rumex salicifolius]